jgi:hypothetical protein
MKSLAWLQNSHCLPYVAREDPGSELNPLAAGTGFQLSSGGIDVVDKLCLLP